MKTPHDPGPLPDDDNVIPFRRSAAPASPLSNKGLSEQAWQALQALMNVEAEQGLLGSILVNNKAYDAVVDIVEFDDFSQPVHGRIYVAIGSLIAGGSIADPVTLNNFFKLDEALEQVGGAGYIGKLAASAVTVINAEHYARTIRDLQQRRLLVVAADKICQDAFTVTPERDVAAVLDDAEQLLYDLTKERQTGAPKPISGILERTVEATEAAYQRAQDGGGGAIVVNTGLADVDKILRGMEPGDLVVLAGRPSMGKTALAGTIARNSAASGKRGLIFSLEMTDQQIGMRWLAGETGIATDRQRHGELDGLVDWPKLIEARDELGKLPLHVDDQARLSVAQMRQRARRIKRRHGLDFLMIDHLQLIRQGGRQESRRIEIGDVTSDLKSLGKELGVPVVLLSQLNRNLESRDDKRPMLSDLKESGDIEQDADIVLFLYREEYYQSRETLKRRPNETKDAFTDRQADWYADAKTIKGLAEIHIAKNRNGGIGMAKLYFDEAGQRFRNLAYTTNT
jgi:replicative DNA helicase